MAKRYMAVGISVPAFARRVGADEKAVRKAIENGRLERSVIRGTAGRTTIDPDLGRREWEENRDPSRVRGPAKSGATRTETGPGAANARVGHMTTAPPGEKPRPGGSERPGRHKTTAEERRRLLRAQARKAELQARKLAGSLVEVAIVKRAQFEAARTIRDNVLNVPDRLSAELAAESDPAKVHARLDAELRQALGAAAEALTHG